MYIAYTLTAALYSRQQLIIAVADCRILIQQQPIFVLHDTLQNYIEIVAGWLHCMTSTRRHHSYDYAAIDALWLYITIITQL